MKHLGDVYGYTRRGKRSIEVGSCAKLSGKMTTCGHISGERSNPAEEDKLSGNRDRNYAARFFDCCNFDFFAYGRFYHVL